MGKDAFLSALRERLAGLPQADVQSSVDFYAEMIDERIEDGMPEEEAVRAVGSVEEIASQILADIPLPRLVREKVRERRSLRAWEIVLLVLGAPLWLPLLLAFLAVGLSVWLVLWSLALTLYAVDLSAAAGAAGSVLGCVLSISQGHSMPAVFHAGAALCCAGLTIFLFFGSNASVKGLLRLSRAIALRIKSAFVRKEAVS